MVKIHLILVETSLRPVSTSPQKKLALFSNYELDITMISERTISQLQELTHEINIEQSIQKLIAEHLESKISYWQLIDKQFELKKGMAFQEYQDTKYEEWDGINWKAKDEFLEWESAIAAIRYFTSLRDKWILTNSLCSGLI